MDYIKLYKINFSEIDGLPPELSTFKEYLTCWTNFLSHLVIRTHNYIYCRSTKGKVEWGVCNNNFDSIYGCRSLEYCIISRLKLVSPSALDFSKIRYVSPIDREFYVFIKALIMLDVLIPYYYSNYDSNWENIFIQNIVYLDFSRYNNGYDIPFKGMVRSYYL